MSYENLMNHKTLDAIEYFSGRRFAGQLIAHSLKLLQALIFGGCQILPQ